MRFHVIGLPHTVCSKEYSSCAYTQKVFNFCKMMKSLGHTVYHYGGEESTPDCDEHITTITKEERKKWWGSNDWKKEFFKIDWDSNLPYWKTSNGRAIAEIAQRIEKKDFICVIGGNCQKPIADAFPEHMTVEFGIGYQGTFSAYRVFESYAWMHYVYGLDKTADGKNYDIVIPNYYDPADFTFSEEKDDYYLFIGRLVSRKGPHIAGQVCEKIGAKLKVAGQGAIKSLPGKIIAEEVKIEGNVEYVGTVGFEERGKLMSRAKAVFVPTQYIGPFEGVHVEAMLCGTPVITTDWGCFSETVIDGKTGYRTRSMGEMMWAAKEVEKLNKKDIRDYALTRYSIDVVRYRYQDYFSHLLTLWDKGWYAEEYDPGDKRERGNFI